MAIDWRSALLLETEVAILIRDQERYGVKFNIGKARYCITLLDNLKKELEVKIIPILGFSVTIEELKSGEEYKWVNKIFMKSGEYSRSVLNWYPEDPSIVEGIFSRISIEEASLSKRGCIIKALLKLGWKPKEFTDKGTPKITHEGIPVDTLDKVGDFGKELSLWYVYSHRQSQIQGLLDNVREDGRIEAQMNTCATNTFRAAHRIVANIPRPTSVFGKEMRSLFTCEDGRKLVGCDASGLELRMLAHSMGDPSYIDIVLNGDVHTTNMNAAGLDSRNLAKSMIYCFLYGGGDSKLGSVVGLSAKGGKALREKLLTNLPALGKLIDKCKYFSERTGYLPSIDNRKIRLRSWEGKVLLHTALNCLLQANGSILCKRAMILADKEFKAKGLDARQVLYVHDEVAIDCEESIAEEVAEILCRSFREAGEYYKLKIRTDGESHIGDNWGDIH